MKKILRLSVLACLIASICMLASCGGGKADDTYVGKWVPVVGEAMGFTLTGDDISGFELELQNGGKAVLTVDGESENVKWTNEGNTITITENGIEITGTAENDTIVFEDMLNTGLKLTFAKEGTEAANPENYIPEAEKNMLGTWESDSVTDVLGEPVDVYAPDALKLEFFGDRTLNITLDGETVSDKKWSLLGDDWGNVDDEVLCMYWDIKEDGIEVNYITDDEYYIFHCVKK